MDWGSNFAWGLVISVVSGLVLLTALKVLPKARGDRVRQSPKAQTPPAPHEDLGPLLVRRPAAEQQILDAKQAHDDLLAEAMAFWRQTRGRTTRACSSWTVPSQRPTTRRSGCASATSTVTSASAGLECCWLSKPRMPPMPPPRWPSSSAPPSCHLATCSSCRGWAAALDGLLRFVADGGEEAVGRYRRVIAEHPVAGRDLDDEFYARRRAAEWVIPPVPPLRDA